MQVQINLPDKLEISPFKLNDSSPLIALEDIGELDLLQSFTSVF